MSMSEHGIRESIPSAAASTNWAGGEFQVIVSNPEYDVNTKDKLEQDYLKEQMLFGKRNGPLRVEHASGATTEYRAADQDQRQNTVSHAGPLTR